MKTLQEDIDDLDRMVDTDASKDAIRSQIRLISRELAALEADCSRIAQELAKLQEALTKANEENAKLIAEKKQRDRQVWNDAARRYQVDNTYSDE